jgi:hypothetical protein
MLILKQFLHQSKKVAAHILTYLPTKRNSVQTRKAQPTLLFPYLINFYFSSKKKKKTQKAKINLKGKK